MREQNALPNKCPIPINSTAKDAIENGGAERAAKGAIPTTFINKNRNFNTKGCGFCFFMI